MATGGAQYQVRALDRALQILGLFNLEQSNLSLSEIAAKTELSPSTVLRLLTILMQHGYIERSRETDRFRIGVGMFERGSIYIQSTSLERESREALETLARESNQTASLAVVDRSEIVHIAVYQAERAIRYYAPVGQRESAHSTGLGKVLLAGMSDDEVDTIVTQRGLPGRTDRTITTITTLRSHLEDIRRGGYAMDNEESMIGLRCVAAPVYDDRHNVVAAVSASGPSAEFDEDRLPELIKSVKRAGMTVSHRIGYRAAPLDGAHEV